LLDQDMLLGLNIIPLTGIYSKYSLIKTVKWNGRESEKLERDKWNA